MLGVGVLRVLFDLDLKLDLYFGRFQSNIYVWLLFGLLWVCWRLVWICCVFEFGPTQDWIWHSAKRTVQHQYVNTTKLPKKTSNMSYLAIMRGMREILEPDGSKREKVRPTTMESLTCLSQNPRLEPLEMLR